MYVCATEQAFPSPRLIFLTDLRSVAAQNFEYKMSSA
jgi:hypothetical protein